MNNGGKHAISGLVIIVNHYVITKVGWNISMPHKLYIIVINNVITIKDLDKIWEIVVYNINL